MRQLLVDGAPVLPSAVCLTRDRRLLVGRDAVHAARSAPGGLRPEPEAAHRRPVGAARRRRRRGRRHDRRGAAAGSSARRAGWPAAPIEARDADVSRPGGTATGAACCRPPPAGPGSAPVTLVPEPVAAGWSFLHTPDAATCRSGRVVVVYDFGAGTFDASVVRRTPAGLRGARQRRPHRHRRHQHRRGDRRVPRHRVRARRTGPPGSGWWSRPTPADLRSSILLWDDVRAGKEMLSAATGDADARPARSKPTRRSAASSSTSWPGRSWSARSRRPGR